METLKEKTAKGLMWGGLGNGVLQLLNLVFGIFLARLLSQTDYGMVGMLAIFSALAGVLQEGGFVSALNRKKEVTHNDYNAVFWTGLLISLTLYIIFFFCAPLIARFYGRPELTPLARYIFLGFVVSGFGTVPGAYMFRNMMVRERNVIAVASMLFSGIAGVTMAACGFAYWGIATQAILLSLSTVCLMYWYTRWRPSLPIDFTPVKEMIGFSSKLIITNALLAVNNNIFTVLLGRLYTPHAVGNFTQGYKWNNMGSSLITNMFNSIAQPVFSKTEADTAHQKDIFRKLLRLTAFVSFPLMLTLSVTSREFIVILLTEKWEESSQILQLLCLAGAFTPVSTLFSNLLISRGFSTIFMNNTAALVVLQLIALLVSAPFGIHTMVAIYVCINIVWLLVWFYYVRREIGLTFLETARDIAPYAGLAAVLACAAWLIAKPIQNIYLCFVFKVLFVGGGYGLVLWLLRSSVLKETMTFIKNKKLSQ